MNKPALNAIRRRLREVGDTLIAEGKRDPPDDELAEWHAYRQLLVAELRVLQETLDAVEKVAREIEAGAERAPPGTAVH